MTDQPLEHQAYDEGDENPDEMVGDPVEPDHDLDPSTFDEDEGA